MVISWWGVKIGVKINCVLKFGSHYGQSADMKKQIINLSTFIHILYSLPFLLCLGLHHLFGEHIWLFSCWVNDFLSSVVQ